jgi:hypothetical protein
MCNAAETQALSDPAALQQALQHVLQIGTGFILSAALPGGKERTAEEFASLFARAGFELTRILPTQSALSAIEARVKET